MQGSKKYQEKMFTNFQLSDRIPKKNFYRILNEKQKRKNTVVPPLYVKAAQ